MSELKQALVNEIVSRMKSINGKATVLAKEYGVLPSDLSHLQNGKAMNLFTLDKVVRIGEAFGVGFDFTLRAVSVADNQRMAEVSAKSRATGATVGSVDFSKFED